MAEKAQETEQATTEADAPAPPVCFDTKIRNYMLGSMAVCLIPAPLLDLAAITALQAKMVADLAEAHGVSYKDNLGRSLIMGLVGTLGASHLALGTVGSVLKLLPGVGYLAAAVSLPVLVGGTTYALGRVFQAHFATGGTLLDFDVDKMREHFQAEFEKGKDVAKASKKAAKAKAS